MTRSGAKSAGTAPMRDDAAGGDGHVGHFVAAAGRVDRRGRL